MRAWLPTGRASDPIELAEIDRPTPGPGELLVEVRAYSINRGETILLGNPRPGWRPGKDIAGVVAEVGSGVEGWRIGDRVVAHPDSAGWAEFAVVAVHNVAALPDSVDDRTAAALPLAGLTALRLLRVAGPIAGKRVLLTGASGGLGHYLVELAAAQGAIITALTSTPARGERLLELGAHEVLASVEDTEGHFDVVFESVGGPTLTRAWARLDKRGLLIWLGQASGTPITLDFFNWSGAESGTLRKFSYHDSDIPDGTDLATLVRLVHGGHLHPEIGDVRSWTETPKALRALLDRAVRGNLVLTVDEEV
ncbi:zinc-binding dehydrogenase [Pseudonocardia spinosispora]|uniref:zinc-binding dehydrogenase n=1 Tax=Pseudonocardia spinosispora TaxID=103441 RepID=UPI0004018BE6|nr:zinc-binding dehydrogenase [Pseudonocardia spinosispora]